MKVELLGKHVFVAEVISKACQSGRVVESERAQTAILGKVDGKMACNRGTTTFAHMDQLIARIVGIVRGLAHSIKPCSSGMDRPAPSVTSASRIKPANV